MAARWIIIILDGYVLFLTAGFILFWIGTASADLDETYEKGLSALKNGKYSQALEYLGVAATNQNANAQFTLGQIFRSGIGVAANLNTSLRWFEASAKNNHVTGQYVISWMYRNGIGTDVNQEKSFMWMLKAAESGFMQARTEVAWMYATGTGVTHDLKNLIFGITSPQMVEIKKRNTNLD